MMDNYTTQLLGPRVRGSHRDTWRTLVHKDLTALGVVYKWHELAKDRLGAHLEEAHCVCTYLGWDLILPRTQYNA